MQPSNSDKQRRHREATSKAMKALIKTCPHCQRRSNPRRVRVPEGFTVKVCPHCKREF